MKRKHIPLIAILLLLGIAIISLPDWLNKAMQHRLSEKALLFNRMGASCMQFLEERYANAADAESLAEALLEQKNFCIARILYRPPSTFNSVLWVDKGSLDSPLIKKNSPVLACDSLVGVVEYVGPKASSIRLITDTKLEPAVRVVRNRYDPALRYAINLLQDEADKDALCFRSNDEKVAFMWMLQRIKEQQSGGPSCQYLAKGTLQGQGGALWKQENCVLQGYGFNYDFRDERGQNRDLRTGKLVEVGDLLITSGLDGVFPEGLKVATVCSIEPLTEGAFAYELTAAPTASDIANLDYLTILAPQEFDSSSLPAELDLILNQISE